MAINKFNKNIWIKDPIHGFLEFHHEKDKIFLELMDSPEMQRLRRIKQLGNLENIYPAAEHSRFTHVLGTYNTAKLAFKHFSERKLLPQKNFREELEIPVLAAALLHDIGHGPFSHNFEMLSGIPHEEFSKAIILGKTDINQILNKYDSSLPKKIVELLEHSFSWPVGNAMISSQLDMDRLDYICRDSYMTGANYGFLDIQRILSVLTVHQDQLAVLEKGVGTIEEYLLARFYMYWDVYFHKTSRGMTLMLAKILDRVRELIDSGDFGKQEMPEKRLHLLFQAMEKEKVNSYVDDFLKLDDTDIVYLLKKFQNHRDSILSDLCGRYLNRNLFKPLEYSHDQDMDKIRSILERKGLDSRYYLLSDSRERNIYTPNPIHSSYDKGIKVFVPGHDTLFDLSEVSVIIGQLSKLKYKQKKYLYLPEEIRQKILADKIISSA